MAGTSAGQDSRWAGWGKRVARATKVAWAVPHCDALQCRVVNGELGTTIAGERVLDVFDFIDAELARIGEIAPAGYFLALRIRGSAPLMAFKTYPREWIDRYMENGYLLRDPITTWSMTVGGTIRWSSPFLIDPFRVLKQAAEFGLTYGASVAHGPLGALSICSAGRSDREMTDAEIAEIKAIVIGLHDRTALPKALTDEEKAILKAMAQGIGPEDAAAKLALTPAAARARFRQVCTALFAQNPSEAVQRARDYKLL